LKGLTYNLTGMSLERKSAQFTLEEVTRLARKVALEHGGHVPLLIAEGGNGAVVGQLEDLPNTHQGRVRYLHAAGARLAQSREVGVLERVFFVCEGWMSTVREDGTMEMPPSQDPDRTEVLFISSLIVEGQLTDMIFFEMIRGGEGQLTGLEQLHQPGAAKGGRVDSPLLSAFVEGFRRGTSGQFN
jgi:hypothetical protein